ncbi:hypothetical protein Hypma_010924 [Hypsizygus marmoreus]|uniref:Uncharacterized protein n=1 Tax=Hypsizygus marmoreus TaxID=39966 RepID=A0A369JQ13_HYPMA|nr:hypothetical protein Hypma_010924 [Hypsizygus marmoreus]
MASTTIIPPLQPGVTYCLSPVLDTFALQKHAIKWLREAWTSHDRSQVLGCVVIDTLKGKFGAKKQSQAVADIHCVTDEHVQREQFYESTRIGGGRIRKGGGNAQKRLVYRRVGVRYAVYWVGGSVIDIDASSITRQIRFIFCMAGTH